MILEGIIVALFAMVRELIELFPNESPDWPEGAGLAAIVGEYAGPMDAVLPLSELAATLGPTVEILLPVILSARVTLFLYYLTPFVK